MGVITAIYSLNTDDMKKYAQKDILTLLCYPQDSTLTESVIYDTLSIDKVWYDFEPFFRGIVPYVPRAVYRGGKQTDIDYKGMDVGYWSRPELVWILQVAQVIWDGEDGESPRPVTIQSTHLDKLFINMESALQQHLAKGDIWKMESGDPFTPDMARYVFDALKKTIVFLIKAHETGNKAIMQISS